jgi:regulator of sigma E protease
MFIVYAILIFALLIFVHEFGHLITAKAVGIRVKEFAIGMGPRLVSVTKGDTRYSVRPFPIGGFCAMEGEDEESDDPKAFNNRPAPARALVLVAGSCMNILLAILILSILIFANGEPTTRIDAITAESPALIAGLHAGDELLAIDGKRVDSWAEVTEALTSAAAFAETKSAGVELRVRRSDGSEQTIRTHMYPDETGAYRIGITPAMSHSPAFFFQSFKLGADATWRMTQMMYKVIGDLFTGKAGIDQLTGPVGIVKAVGDTARAGGIYVAELAALISLNLGIVNLLPLPALDGGRILFLIIRLFTGRRVSDVLEARIHTIGIFLLFGLMAYITLIDVNRFILH